VEYGGSVMNVGVHDHDWVQLDDEYGSLAQGGSYEVWECSVCGQRRYVQLPD
jgi:hypothetical protein